MIKSPEDISLNNTISIQPDLFNIFQTWRKLIFI